MQNHPGGDSVALGIVSIAPRPPPPKSNWGDGVFSLLGRILGDWENVRTFFFFFRSVNYLTRANFTLYDRISPQWLPRMRRLWLNVL